MAIRDKQPDADVGRVIVDNDLESLEKRITVSYGKAAKDITTDLDAFLAKYETKDAKKREDVANGLLSEEDYIDWRKRQIFQSDAMKAKIDDLSQRMVNADKQAMAMVNNELPEIYATSYNFGGFRGEKYAQAAGFDYTQFTIINQDAVKTLMKEDPDLIPWKPQVDGRADKAWNRKHIQSAVEQGIIKGEGMDKISKRLLPVVGMDKTAAIRTARTAVNGVENKGRTDATQRVVEAGIPMVQQWSCTHDNRTRFTHILIDGETISVGGYFSNGLRYPADPSGDPAEVYNCRCSAISVLEGIDHSKDDELYEQFMKDEYYEDWVKVKEDREAKEEAFQERKEKAEEWAGKQQEKALETGVAQEVDPVVEKPIEWKQATNRQEANELLQDMGFGKISSGTKKIDEEIYVANANRLSELTTKFVPIPDNIPIETGKMRAGAYVKHGYDGEFRSLKLGNDTFTNKTYEQFKEDQDQEGYHKSYISTIDGIETQYWFMPCSDDHLIDYTITHEYGHILQESLIFTDEYKEGFNKILNDNSLPRWEKELKLNKYYRNNHDDVAYNQYKEIIQIAQDKNPDFDWHDVISRYGKTNSAEFFAECFANSQCGKPNELGDAMNEWLRRKGYDT